MDEMVLALYDQLVRYLDKGLFPDFVLNKSDILAGTKLRHEDCLPAAQVARNFVQRQMEGGGLDQKYIELES